MAVVFTIADGVQEQIDARDAKIQKPAVEESDDPVLPTSKTLRDR